MDLNPLDAALGYKYASDRVRDPPHQLATEDQLRAAMEKGINKIRLARSREVILEIHNLVSFILFSSVLHTDLKHQRPARAAASATGRKRTAAENSTVGDDGAEPDTAVSFKTELRELKQKLACQKHTGKYCYVDPTKQGEHIALDIYKLTLWAKKIVGFIFVIYEYI
jgi:hypothetical protein